MFYARLCGAAKFLKGLSNAELITVSADNRDGLVEDLVEPFTQAVSIKAKQKPN